MANPACWPARLRGTVRPHGTRRGNRKMCDHRSSDRAKWAVRVFAIAAVLAPVLVLPARGDVRYHGRIDDQFVARQKKNANPSAFELRDAIAAVLAGREVSPDHVAAVGCPIPRPAAQAGGPTYAGDVALILQKHCQECH